jgi:hypothetical protein
MMADTLHYRCGSEKTDVVQLGGSSSNRPSRPRIQQRSTIAMLSILLMKRFKLVWEDLTRIELMATRRLWDAGSAMYQLRYISTLVFIGNSHGSI